MFKFIFDLATEPLGLPIDWYYEWIILGVIGYIAYSIAYDKVGSLYHGILFQGEQQAHFLTGLFELFILSLCGLLHME